MSLAKKLSGPGGLKAQSSSVFDLASGMKAKPCGSSITSFAYEPRDDMARHSQVAYENTYRMDPDRKFRPDFVNSIITEVLESNLSDKTYEPIVCSTMCRSLAQEIMSKLKKLDFKRYKLVALVTIGEKKEQGVRIGSRCVWDADRDNSASVTYENPSLFATGVVYAAYYE